MGNPRTNNQSRATTQGRANESTANLNFLANEPSVSVQEFLDEKVLAYEGKVVEFRYDEGQSKRVGADGKPRQKVSFLTVKMPKMRIENESLVPDDKWDENGEVINAPMLNVQIRASYEANDTLIKQKGTKNPLEGINVSVFHATDQATGKETGEAGYMLTLASGESADLSALGLRF